MPDLFQVFPPRPVLSFVDTGSPDDFGMNVPFPSRCSKYSVNANPAGTGTPYYVRPGVGSDSNNGLTIGTAFATIQGAHTVTVAGDTINCLDSGPYHEGDWTITKAVYIQPYFANLGVCFWDARIDISANTWTFDAVNQAWWTTFVSPAKYAVSTEWPQLRQNAGLNGTVLTDPNCVYAMPVTVNGQVVKGCGGLGGGITSITRSGTTATVATSAAHNLGPTGTTLSSVVIRGATQTAYNGTFTIVITGTNTFTYTVAGSPATPATGTLSWTPLDANHHWHDITGNRLYLGQNPAGKVIKAPTFERAFIMAAAAVVRGFVFRCYSPNYAGTAATISVGNGASVIENCLVAYSASDGVNINGGSVTGSTLQDCHLIYNLTGRSMQSGVIGHHDYNVFSYRNNVLWQYCSSWHDGGFKQAGTQNCLNEFGWAEENRGNGLWGDFMSTNNTWANCVALNNSEIGLFHEKCQGSNNTTGANRMIGCVSHGNWVGMYLIGDLYTVAINCTLGNNFINLYCTSDSRNSSQANTGIIYENNISYMTIGNTVVPGTVPTRHYHALNQGSETVNFTTSFASFKNNIMWTDPRVSLPTKVSWATTNSNLTSYASRAAWIASGANGFGLDAGGLEDVNGKGDPYLTDPLRYEWTPKVIGKVVGKTITTLQRNLAKFLGLADTVAPPVGASVFCGIKTPLWAAYDDFGRADSTTSLGTSASLHVWTPGQGTHGIISGKGYSVTDADGDYATIDSHVTNGHYFLTVEGTLNSATIYRVPRFILAGLSGSTFLEAFIWNGSVYLYKRDAGTYSLLQSQAGQTTTDATQYIIHVKREDKNFSIYVDSVFFFTYTLAGTNVQYMTGTLAGWHLAKLGSPTSPARFDNLMIKPL